MSRQFQITSERLCDALGYFKPGQKESAGAVGLEYALLAAMVGGAVFIAAVTVGRTILDSFHQASALL